MKKLAKVLVKNLALIAFMVGLIGSFINYDELKEQRAANTDVIKIEIDRAGSREFVGRYVEIQGGIAELRETYEFGIGDMGDGEEMLASEFYYPVVLVEGGAPQFIVVADSPPAFDGNDPTNRTGLLKTHGDIPEKVADAFAAQYPETSFALLNTQYSPEPLANLYVNLIAFVLLVIASLLAYGWAVREAPEPEEAA